MHLHHLIGSAPHNSPGMAGDPKIPSCLRSSWAAYICLKGASRSNHEALEPVSCRYESGEASVVVSQCSADWGTQHPHLSGGCSLPCETCASPKSRQCVRSRWNASRCVWDRSAQASGTLKGQITRSSKRVLVFSKWKISLFFKD